MIIFRKVFEFVFYVYVTSATVLLNPMQYFCMQGVSRGPNWDIDAYVKNILLFKEKYYIIKPTFNNSVHSSVHTIHQFT